MGAVRPVADPSVSPCVPAAWLENERPPKPASLGTQGLFQGMWSRVKACLHLILAWSVRMPRREAGSPSEVSTGALRLPWGEAAQRMI